MDYARFAKELPGLYSGWGTQGVVPRLPRFHKLLGSVRGMTTANVLQLLNFALACLEQGEAYVEVGCFQGATLIGALLGRPPCPAYAVDNFSEFDRQGTNQAWLRRNLAAFGLLERVRFHNMDFEEFFLSDQLNARIGVYVYDGAHDYRSQLLGLLLAVPFLAKRALLIVDDANEPSVKQATWDFLSIRPESRLLLDLPTRGNGDVTFWNGLYVLAWDRNTAKPAAPKEFYYDNDALSTCSFSWQASAARPGTGGEANPEQRPGRPRRDPGVCRTR
jgi:hypothetical protein